MLPQWIIAKKRDGQALTEEEIHFFIEGYGSGDIPDYQMSALAMAIYFQDMTFGETAVLTDTMMNSGSVLDTSSIDAPTADKHSTGGVGDKVSLILAPLVACAGIAVPMISGRGLGITGGTLDKLESIPGYRTDLSTDEFLATIRECGCSIIGQTAELAPVDKKLYALRDVTGTVPSIPLITASIMSKKLAENTDALVLDVKWGKGAFMKTLEDATRLAETMVEVGTKMGRKMAALLTDMNQPLGHTAGNALEIVETIESLRGDGPEDLMTVTLELSACMLTLTDKAANLDEARDMLHGFIASGMALEKFRTMVRLQGGDPGITDDTSLLPAAEMQRDFPAPASGYISAVNAETIGKACIVLGAGRREVEDNIDHAVGVSGLVKIGQEVKEGDKLLTLHSNNPERAAEAEAMLANAFEISTDRPDEPELIAARISGDDRS
ncbi:MAG: thymidine phosphorylase [Kiritimatiellia bacterium]|jgi:pyrimidine-nucleoside phosphorylase|nr:thymidine phosphorylase [Kiritimatiellia bacterium]